MKKLVTSDLFKLTRILKEIGIKEELKKRVGTDEKDLEKVGADLVFEMLDLATEQKAESMIYDFFSSPFEMTSEEIANLPIAEMIDKLKQLAEENDLSSFFSSVAKLMK